MKLLPEGHSAMDKAFACHACDQGLNPDTTKIYSAPILTGTPAMRNVNSLSQCLASRAPA